MDAGAGHGSIHVIDVSRCDSFFSLKCLAVRIDLRTVFGTHSSRFQSTREGGREGRKERVGSVRQIGQAKRVNREVGGNIESKTNLRGSKERQRKLRRVGK